MAEYPTEQAPLETGTMCWARVPVQCRDEIQMHLLPVNDIAAHLLAPGCKCGAVEDPMVDRFYSHNAFDGREDYERGLRMKH